VKTRLSLMTPSARLYDRVRPWMRARKSLPEALSLKNPYQNLGREPALLVWRAYARSRSADQSPAPPTLTLSGSGVPQLSELPTVTQDLRNLTGSVSGYVTGRVRPPPTSSRPRPTALSEGANSSKSIMHVNALDCCGRLLVSGTIDAQPNLRNGSPVILVQPR
jgi:hypothetical protein